MKPFVASVFACSIIASSSASTLASGLSDDIRSQLDGYIASYEPRMREVAHQIWSRPELGYQEVNTANLLISELEKYGFQVEEGVAGIPTAFVAKAGSDHGPVIAILAEMDALPGFSQDAVPFQQPVDGITSGHACGHHLFGTGSVAAAIAVALWMKDNNVEGQIRLYGTPAEEGGSGKVYMIRAGLFDDVDVVLHWHPGDRNTASQGWSLANVAVKVRFRGVSAHAALSPERGRSALQAVEAFHHMINMMREHVPQETRIHYIVSNGGAAPNVVPAFAESYLYVRNPDPAVVRDIVARIEKAAQGAALGTETEYSMERISGVYSVLPNDTLGHVMDGNLRAAAPIKWDDDEVAFATKMQKTLQATPPLSSVGEVEKYTFGEQGYYSTDVGDVSWVAPTVGLNTATWVPGTPAHSWQAVAAGGIGIGYKGMRLAAETLAFTAAELLQSPELIDQAKAEFEQERGPDFTYSSLIGDRKPALDYRLKN